MEYWTPRDRSQVEFERCKAAVASGGRGNPV